jgi:hypothetical protein
MEMRQKYAYDPVVCKYCGKAWEEHPDGYCETEEPEIVSTLTDQELWKSLPTGSDIVQIASRRAIANAAATRAYHEGVAAERKRICELPSDSVKVPYVHWWNGDDRTAESIAQFQRALKGGKI